MTTSAAPHRFAYWVRRYLRAEVVGTAGALLGAALAYHLSGSLMLAAAGGTIAENLGFYGVMLSKTYREQSTQPVARRRALARTLALSAAEFGPAELADSLVVRPLALYLAPLVTDLPLPVAWFAGKIAADAVFYLVAACGHIAGTRLLERRAHSATHDLAATTRAARIDALFTFARDHDLAAKVAQHGTPLLVVDTDDVAERCRRFHSALGVDLHYAVKACGHAGVVNAVVASGGSFDVASIAEIESLRTLGVDVTQAIHTHPTKRPADIDAAYRAGLRTFVVDNLGELAKFAGRAHDIRLLVRLAYRNPGAKSDLSAKFGASRQEALALVRRARTDGIAVVGFSFHVGSQLDGVAPFVSALTQTLALVDEVDSWGGAPLEVVDLGGGFPVGYRHDAVSIEDIGRALRPLIDSRRGTLRFLAEPGRFLVAESTVLVTSVIGVSQRAGVHWYFLDDGVYGSYSNVMCEDVHPVIVAAKELNLAQGEHEMVRATLAGPTCDSVDVVARNYPLPQLKIGDLLLSPTMGAYTSVTASDFNGIPRTPIIAVGKQARTDAVLAGLREQEQDAA